jgi:hypothetical protein
MSDDDFEEEPELDDDDLDEEVLVEDFDDEDDDLIADDVEEVLVTDLAVIVDDGEPVEVPVEEEDDDIVDLDEELHPDDVEEALDVVLRERTAAAGLEDEDEYEDEPDDRGEGGTKIVPRRENEFLCKSCFLVLPRHQLADEKRMICRDCA